MTTAEKYIEEVKTFNKLFDMLNSVFFENTLSKPVITIQTDDKNRFRGWFQPRRWQAAGAETLENELNISANFLDRKPHEVAATMLHEMCHLYAEEKGIKDTSRGGAWHNKKFAEIAKLHGLTVAKSDKTGYGETALTPLALQKITGKIPAEMLLFRRKDLKGESEPKESSVRKYLCVKCGCSVRATSEVNILCMDCNEKMIIA